MKTIVHEIPYSPASNLDEEIFTASSVFFDIETTGFSPAHTSLYLIGCAYHIEQMLYIKQFFTKGAIEYGIENGRFLPKHRKKKKKYLSSFFCY